MNESRDSEGWKRREEGRAIEGVRAGDRNRDLYFFFLR